VLLQDRARVDRRQIEAIPRRECKLWAQPALAPELGPVVAPAVRLRCGADVVVAAPAEARTRRAVGFGEHAPQGGKIAAAFELEILEKQIGAARCHTVRARLGRPHAARPQCTQPLGLGGEGIGEPVFIQLEKSRLAGDRDPVAAVDAAAGDRFYGIDPKERSQLGRKRAR
jgi:hypothetical protein